MEATIIVALIGAAVALLSFHGGRAVNKAQKNMIEAETLGKLSTQIIDLQGKYNTLHNEQLSLRNQLEKLDDKNRILWQYVYTLIEQIKKKKLTPVTPPAELESDPQLIKLLKKK
jgi:cell division protein FtsB